MIFSPKEADNFYHTYLLQGSTNIIFHCYKSVQLTCENLNRIIKEPITAFNLWILSLIANLCIRKINGEIKVQNVYIYVSLRVTRHDFLPSSAKAQAGLSWLYSQLILPPTHQRQFLCFGVATKHIGLEM